MVVMKELQDLDPSMSMSRTVEVLTKALDSIPFKEGQSLSLSSDQSQVLDLVDTKIDEAEGYFDRPVDEPVIYQRLVSIGKASGRDDLVSKFGRRTAQIESADLEFRARLQAFFGATSRAVGLFQQSVDLTPDFQEAVDGLGRAERRVAKSTKALQKLEDVSRAKSSSAKAWTDLGQAYADLDRLDDALAAFERAVKLAPTDIPALCKKGGVLAAMGRVEEGKECFEAALAIDANSLNGKRGLNYTTYMLEH
jgi:tetratricopeptide (TPR) repeat protein